MNSIFFIPSTYFCLLWVGEHISWASTKITFIFWKCLCKPKSFLERNVIFGCSIFALHHAGTIRINKHCRIFVFFSPTVFETWHCQTMHLWVYLYQTAIHWGLRSYVFFSGVYVFLYHTNWAETQQKKLQTLFYMPCSCFPFFLLFSFHQFMLLLLIITLSIRYHASASVLIMRKR